MNFDHMPELHWGLGYAYVYLLFLAVVLLAVLLMWYNGLIKVNVCVCVGGGGLAVLLLSGWKGRSFVDMAVALKCACGCSL
jgi:hypothetical protein